MDWLIEQGRRLKIRVRLAIFIWLMVALAGSGVLAWAFHAQRGTAIAQAIDFAESVHQMTLAGLTGMMITGTGSQRAVFLDQIKQSNNIRSLRVIRSGEVSRQYGPGAPDAAPLDDLERRVLEQGRPAFVTRREGGGEVMRAILPALARTNYLGKNCLGCHRVAEGAVLGAVAMDISLDKVNAAVETFVRGVSWTAALISVPLVAFIYLSLSRSVTRPLRAMADGLNAMAGGRVDLERRLAVHGGDEIADAALAFNRVMDKVDRLVRDERISADVFEHALEGIIVTDRAGRILKVNPAFTRTTGYPPEEAVGRTPAILRSGEHDEKFYREFWEALILHGQWQGDIWNRRRNGEIYPEWLNVSSVRNERGAIEYYIALFSDITERKRQEAVMRHQALHDSLTGLPNRVLFRDRLEQAFAAARRDCEQAGAVMFLDLDGFKSINDGLGHDVGDQLLVEVARRLRAAVRAVDTVARMGGDEFTVLLPGIAKAEDAAVVAAKILDATGQAYRIGGRDVRVTTSIGISLFPADGELADEVLKNADAAMYEIKERGRSGYRFYGSRCRAEAA